LRDVASYYSADGKLRATDSGDVVPHVTAVTINAEGTGNPMIHNRNDDDISLS
jgi:hypothetical protein